MMNLKNKSNPKDEQKMVSQGVHCVKEYGSLETKEMIDLFDLNGMIINQQKNNYIYELY